AAADRGPPGPRTPPAPFRPRSTSAAARRSSSLPLVHDPTNTVSTATSVRGVPGARSMYARARCAVARAAGSVIAAGSGTADPSGPACAGLGPQVTNGVRTAASSVTSRSKTASGSVGSDGPHATAGAQAAP